MKQSHILDAPSNVNSTVVLFVSYPLECSVEQ